jgi:hypothetical protein
MTRIPASTATCIRSGASGLSRRVAAPVPFASAACTSGRSRSTAPRGLIVESSVTSTTPSRFSNVTRWAAALLEAAQRLGEVAIGTGGSRGEHARLVLERVREAALEVVSQRAPGGPDQDGDGEEEDGDGARHEAAGKFHRVVPTFSALRKR